MLTSEVTKTDASVVILKYKDAEIVSFTSLFCNFAPNDIISIRAENSAIQFKCINKVINFKIRLDRIHHTSCVIVTIDIIDKGSKVV